MKALLPLLLFLLVPALLVGDTYTGKCVGITDGDTISVMHSGKAVKIQLEGIDCPEHRTVDPKVGGSSLLTHPIPFSPDAPDNQAFMPKPNDTGFPSVSV